LKKIHIATDQGDYTAHVIGTHGEWVVCWPSQLSDLESVADFALMLARDYRVVVCEPPAVGTNTHLPYSNAINDMVFYAHRVLTHLGIDQCHWVGQSAGGVVGAALHSAAPGRIQSLTLIGTPMLSQGRLKVHLAATTALLAGSKLGRRLLAARIVKDLGYRDEKEKKLISRYFSRLLEQLDPKTIAALRPIDGASVRRVFERLRQNPPPMLVLGGEADPIVLLRDQRTVAEITQARFVKVPSGHMTLLVEPDVCAHAFFRFMQHLQHPSSRPSPLSAAA
jgi:3-oxoadipate enol-lactonase